MAADNPCPLCDPSLGPVLVESAYWRLVLNHNQDLLGKCFLSLRRHSEVVGELSPQEWSELQVQVGVGTVALQRTFHPDHVNYAFLQNQDRHVHLHIIPRYATRRDVAGECFVDMAYPDHYAVGSPPRAVTPMVFAEIADTLRDAVRTVRAEANH